MQWTNNIAIVQKNLGLKLSAYKDAMKKALIGASDFYVMRWIILKYLSGRPGLRRITGRAQRSWKFEVKNVSGGNKGDMRATMYSHMGDRDFNYLKAHQDPQPRQSKRMRFDTIMKGPAKIWTMPKRLNILEEWGEGTDFGEGAKAFAKETHDQFIRFAKDAE
jgi:hypothetical protein